MLESTLTEGQLKLLETRGYSAYEVAVLNGYSGTEQEWLASLVGPQGPRGEEGVLSCFSTSDRPSEDLENGLVYFDTTLKKPIYYYDEKWYDATGQEVN